MRPPLSALLAVAAIAAALPRPAAAQFSMVDGSSLGIDTSAVHVRLGIPNLGVDYLAGHTDDLDFGFGLLVAYLQPTLEPAFLFRWRVAAGEEFNLALTARTGIHWNMGLWRSRQHPRNFGLRLTPGLALGMNPHPVYSTYFTVEAPFLWTWGYGHGWALPIRAGMGFEYAMTPDVKFVVFGGAGPRFEGGGGHVGGTFFDGDLWLGMSFQMF
jgi:hypothetical protein